jgi:hypothetical protein
MHCCIEPYYLEYAKDIFNKFSGMVYLCVIACFMITVFVISVLIDKVRLACFNFIWNRYEKRFIKHQLPLLTTYSTLPVAKNSTVLAMPTASIGLCRRKECALR